jgi:hypothetical protein
LKQKLKYLFQGVPLHRLAANRGVKRPYASKKETQVRVQLTQGSYGGTEPTAKAILAQGDGGGQPFYLIYGWAGLAGQKLPHVGTQTFYISAKTLCIQGIKGEGGFAGAAGPAYHDKLMPRKGDGDIFEGMLPGPTNADGFGEGGH